MRNQHVCFARRVLAWAALVSMTSLEAVWPSAPIATPEQAGAAPVDERAVLPIFQMRCVVCHGKRKQEGGLDLRSHASQLKGGKSGPAIVPGNPDQSLLIQRITSGEMPPAKLRFENSVRPPTSAEIETLRRWIAAGAPASPSQAAPRLERDAADAPFWAFQPPRRPAVPDVRNQDRVRTPVDAFLLEALEARGKGFSADAEPRTLLRRAYLDLTGLPPGPEEIDRFLDDRAGDRYERWIDRLLASPHYGERWGQYWLDAAGYADSEGKVDDDRVRPWAWRYRDWVIRAFNADKPYDEFLTEQLAGDELVDYRNAEQVTPDAIDKLVATGFLRMAPDGTYSPPQSFIPERMNVIADELEVLSSAVLGLTMGCARCHNHKYDPLSQRDYYRLSAILQTAYDPYDWLFPTQRYLDVATAAERQEVERHNVPLIANIERSEHELAALREPLRAQLFARKLAALPEPIRDDVKRALETAVAQRDEIQGYLAERFAAALKVEDSELPLAFPDFAKPAEKLEGEIAELRKQLREAPKVRALYDMGGEPSTAYLLHRGEALAPVEAVAPGVPVVLSAALTPYEVKAPWPGAETSGRRLALARWLTQPNHPLTARVLVNRLWMHHFGRGLVATPANFGRTGQPPSHPELLDWLATEFVRQGWSIKAIHRLIMTSTAYRQSSQYDPERHADDPDNVLVSRMSLRRMEGEVQRDAMLFVTGRLDTAQFGLPADVEILPNGEVVAKETPRGWRRSIYVLARRRSPLTMLELFDVPPLTPNCIQRPFSTVATQALQLTNSAALKEHARHLAGVLIDQYGDDPTRWLREAYVRVNARNPSDEERQQGKAFLEELTGHWREHLQRGPAVAEPLATAQRNALADFCQALVTAAEFSYVD